MCLPNGKYPHLIPIALRLIGWSTCDSKLTTGLWTTVQPITVYFIGCQLWTFTIGYGENYTVEFSVVDGNKNSHKNIQYI